jgi:hypothetical protein
MKTTLLRFLSISLTGIFSSGVFAQNWSPCSNGMDKTVYALCADTVNNFVYAGGAFIQAGRVTANHIARWDGTAWYAMGMNMGTNYSMLGTNDTVMSLCMYQGNLYAGGHFTTAEGNTAPHIAMWNGTNWSAVGTSMNGDVHAMTVYQGELYASGEFTLVDGTPMNHIARWNGTSWSIAGAGLSDDAEALIVYQGNLYAGGDFFMSGTDSCKNMAMWNGSVWAPVGTGMSTSSMMVNMGMPSMVHSLAVWNGSLYAGGMFLGAGGMSCANLAKWNGTAWSSPGNVGSGAMSDNVTSLCTYKGLLCIGGMFSAAGGQSMSNMAQCNGSAWAPLDAGANNQVFAMTTLHGTLYSGGSFTTAGGSSNMYISQFADAAGIREWDAETSSAAIFPNPLTTSSATLRMTVPVNKQHACMVIYDLLGMEIASLPLSGMEQNNSDTWSFKLTPTLSSGVFFFSVMDGQHILGKGKLIIP